MWCLSRARGSEGWGKVVNVSSYEAADEMRHVFIVIALYGPVDPSEPNGKGCKSSKLWWQLRSQVGGGPMNCRYAEILFGNPVLGKCHAADLWEVLQGVQLLEALRVSQGVLSYILISEVNLNLYGNTFPLKSFCKFEFPLFLTTFLHVWQTNIQ